MRRLCKWGEINDTISYILGWNKIKEKLVSLANLILNEVKKAIEIMWPQIKQKLTEIVQIILNTAKQAIVNIAGEMIFVTLPPSLR